MRRVLALLLTTTLMLAAGCGLKSYEFRLDKTLELMRYRQRLDAHLQPAPEDDTFKNFPLYLRPAKDLQLAGSFTLAQLPPGQFDLARSFLGQGQPPRSLHVLARKPVPKKAAGKEAPEATPQRGPFEQDVLNLLMSVYGALEPLQAPKYKTDRERVNEFRHLTFGTPDGGTVHVYFTKQGQMEVALIWVLPAAVANDPTSMATRSLTLGSFAVGPRAMTNFAGGVGTEEEEGAGGPAAKGGGGVAF